MCNETVTCKGIPLFWLHIHKIQFGTERIPEEFPEGVSGEIPEGIWEKKVVHEGILDGVPEEISSTIARKNPQRFSGKCLMKSLEEFKEESQEKSMKRFLEKSLKKFMQPFLNRKTSQRIVGKISAGISGELLKKIPGEVLGEIHERVPSLCLEKSMRGFS